MQFLTDRRRTLSCKTNELICIKLFQSFEDHLGLNSLRVGSPGAELQAACHRRAVLIVWTCVMLCHPRCNDLDYLRWCFK